MTFFLPYLADPEKGRKWGIISLCAATISVTSAFLMILFVLGPDLGNKTYSILVAFRYISIGGIFENAESLLLMIWVVGNFLKIGVFYYATVSSFTQCLKLADYRPYVLPIGILTVIFSMWDVPSFTILRSYLSIIAPFEFTSILMFIPILLLITAVLRKPAR